MANMGYCRFTNTVADLDDCYEHLIDEELSEEEDRARKRLVALCDTIVRCAEAEGIVDDD